MRLRALVVASTLAGWLSMGALNEAVNAQSRPVVESLDTWLVMRFIELRLLPDSEPARANEQSPLGSGTTFPRVEALVRGQHMDTLFAVHFGSSTSTFVLPLHARVRLVSPDGVVVPTTVTVSARRAFRAPRLPRAAENTEREWRSGWAYLVVIPHNTDRPVDNFRGWLLLPVSGSSL